MPNPTPAVNCCYGAPMGRRSDNLSALIITPADDRMTLRRVCLDSGGYDEGGAYWGVGQPIYFWHIVQHEGDTIDESSGYLRARNRDDAKAQIRALHEHVRFKR